MKNYDHKKIEEKWQKQWAQEKIYEADEKSEKPESYILDMFPYPSGDGLHVGHVEGYTATDIYARFRRMKGDNVLHPIGWDAFGLPAENFAIKNKVHPREKTEESIENFKRQLKNLGISYDWSREIGTHRPDYYKWTQWLFLFLYKNDLASRKKAKVNWCESCQTVLANEQVENGICERCKNEVTQKDLKQWFFHITKYADELVSGLDDVDWPSSTKINQKNWIGRSVGSQISFSVAKKFHFVLVHGFKSSPEGSFFAWLKEKLESRGHTVEVPALPNPDDPDVAEQVETVLSETTFDENTIVLGHSLGSVVAAKAIEKRGVKVHKLVTVSGFVLEENTERAKKYIKTDHFSCDYEKVRENIEGAVVLQDTKDLGVTMKMAEKLRDVLGAELVVKQARKPHFREKEEPEVIKNTLPQIEVFTTRADTLFGATYMVLSPEHFLVEALRGDITNWKEVKNYRDESAMKTELERTSEGKKKTGVEIKGVKATNPANGEEIPIYIADYVLSGYGTGAIMAVPAHDERDFEFAKAFDIPVRSVVSPQDGEESEEELFTSDGILENSGEFTSMESEEARKAITEHVGGEMKTTYKLRDWLVSRQRYWGAPIPIIYCEKCGEVPVPEKDLPVLLPDDVDFMPTGESPLEQSKTFHDVKCPECDEPARRESDTMDTFVCSSWYYYRFADPKNEKAFADAESIKQWLPVDVYMGGAEHTVLHLMYARFFTKVLADFGYVDFREPFQKLRHQGMILASDGRKMSKSLGNVVNPDDVMDLYGADTLRIYEMFLGPLDVAKPWSSESIIGTRRFLEKVWRIAAKVGGDGKESEEVQRILHQTIKKVGEDIEKFAFNTAVSQMMICVNALDKAENIGKGSWRAFLTLLAPFAPHITEELWNEIGEAGSIHGASWPEYDRDKIKETMKKVAVQVNGKVRGTIEISLDVSEVEAVRKAREISGIAKYLEGREIKKTIYIPGKILNFVLNS